MHRYFSFANESLCLTIGAFFSFIFSPAGNQVQVNNKPITGFKRVFLLIFHETPHIYNILCLNTGYFIPILQIFNIQFDQFYPK